MKRKETNKKDWKIVCPLCSRYYQNSIMCKFCFKGYLFNPVNVY